MGGDGEQRGSIVPATPSGCRAEAELSPPLQQGFLAYFNC